MKQGKDIKGYIDRDGVKHGVEQKPVGKIGDDTASVAASDNSVSVIADNGGVSVDAASLNLNIHNEEGGTELNITPKEAANLYKAAQDWDDEPTEGSPNIVTSDGIYCALEGKMNVPLRIHIYRDADSSIFEFTGYEADFEAAVKQSRYFPKMVIVEVHDSVYHDTKYYTGVINSSFTDALDYVYVELTIGDHLFTTEAQCQGGEDFNWANYSTLVLSKREFIISE